MDRREALAGFVAGLTGATLKEVPPEPKPLLFVLTLPSRYSHDAALDQIREDWERLHGGSPGRLVLLPSGATLEAVLDPREV